MTEEAEKEEAKKKKEEQEPKIIIEMEESSSSADSDGYDSTWLKLILKIPTEEKSNNTWLPLNRKH